MEDHTIGPYRLLEPLGHGGMGVVYRARHVVTERPVALKTVRVAASRWLESIRREVQALTRIDHPGVVKILDYGVHQGLPWYAMELLEGETMRRFGERLWSPYRAGLADAEAAPEITETEELPAAATGEARNERSVPQGLPVPPAAAGKLDSVLRIMRRVCSTLAYLHGEGFTSCDLKPENIILVADEPVIIDFGLSSQHPAVSGREALEARRGLAGTLLYMSPEQLRGELVDARTDIYAVGCILYELLTGAPPFSGPPRAVVEKHLHVRPQPPSALTEGVPAELERLVLRLLEKSAAERLGYADEVAARLTALCNDVRELPHHPAGRSYLYRPRFVGRDEIMSNLLRLRDRAARGSGSVVTLAGDSGVGKTRLVMELTRLQSIASMRIVTSESVQVSFDGDGAAGAPFSVVQPVLQAVADLCLEGGASVTERLLEERCALLARYEPLLGRVLSSVNVAAPHEEAAGITQQRVFRGVAMTLQALCREKPVMWVIDDLQWADDLSLEFLKSLSADYLADTPLLVIATYRSESSTPAIEDLTTLPHVSTFTLDRLDQRAVSSITQDMLAMSNPPETFVAFMERQVDGNPFFLAEYLRAAVANRLLYRDDSNSWRLAESFVSRDARPELILPSSLRGLLEQRFAKLSVPAQYVCLAAAVLGREVATELLDAVADLPADSLSQAIDELLRRHIFEHSTPGQLRFAHDKLREVAYARHPQSQLRLLHGQAAKALESHVENRPDASKHWATLAHHFHEAGAASPAARYYQLAADHARSTFANVEASRLYREALVQIEQVLDLGTETWTSTRLTLLESLGDVLAVSSQRAAARETYGRAIELTPSDSRRGLARLHRKLGKTWEKQHQHEAALECYSEGERILALDQQEAWSDEWLELRMDRLWAYYWLNRLPELERLSKELWPRLERIGSSLQRARFFDTQTIKNLRRDRFVICEETLQFARLALSASLEAEELPQLLSARLGLGLVLVLAGDLTAGSTQLREALTLAERGGDLAQQARALTYLVLAARLQDDQESTAQLLQRALRVSSEAGMQDYVAAANANYAWLLARRESFAAATDYAQKALKIWQELSFVYSLQWLALLPLMRASLATGDTASAVDCATAMLGPEQQELPGSATDALLRACERWKRGDRSMTVSLLSDVFRELEPSLEISKNH